jgi:hypothetical protein
MLRTLTKASAFLMTHRVLLLSLLLLLPVECPGR